MAKAKKILNFILVSLLFLGLTGYVVFAMIGMSKPDPDAKCTAVQLVVKKNPNANFIKEKEVEAMLRKADLYPKGKSMSAVSTKAIEDIIRDNDFIEKVECYKTSDNKLCINIEQRTPILCVIPEGRDGYFVDAKGNVMKITNYVSNLITATGAIDKKFATTDLKDLAHFIYRNEFWNSQVEQIYVSLDKHNKPVVEIIPRIGNQVVYLGAVDNFEKKFDHLKKFYEKAMNTVGWNKYERIDLQYENQIICTKHKK